MSELEKCPICRGEMQAIPKYLGGWAYMCDNEKCEAENQEIGVTLLHALNTRKPEPDQPAADSITQGVVDSRCKYLTLPGMGCNKCGNIHDGGKPAAGQSEPVDARELWRAAKLGDYSSIPAAPAVLDGYCIMPRTLTTENGAKALLMGEFNAAQTITCPLCGGDDDEMDVCDCCEGEGEIVQSVPISWTTIKEIYNKTVKHFAVSPEQQDYSNGK